MNTTFIILFIIIILIIIFDDEIEFYILNKYNLNINNLLKIKNSPYNNIDLYQNQLWISTITKNGALIIPNIVSDQDCNHILKIISNEQKCSHKFTEKIRSNLNREYMFLPLEHTTPFIKKIYLKLKHFCDTLIPNTKLLESSSFISYPVSFPQRFHIDALDKNQCNIFTFAIALEDITPNMGPIEYYMESHKISNNIEYIRQKYNLKKDKYSLDSLQKDHHLDGYKYNIYEEVCKTLKLKKHICTCKKGSLIIWSWNVIHRGGKNTEKIRPLFYFSLKDGTKDKYNHTTYDDIIYTLEKKNNLTYILSHNDNKN